MRIQTQLLFNSPGKTKKAESELIHEHIILPLLEECTKTIKCTSKKIGGSGNKKVSTDLIVFNKEDLVKIFLKHGHEGVEKILHVMTHSDLVIRTEL